MNIPRLAAVATIALIGTGGWAQEMTPEQAQIQAAQFPATESASQDVGGVEPGVGGGAPHPAKRVRIPGESRNSGINQSKILAAPPVGQISIGVDR